MPDYYANTRPYNPGLGRLVRRNHQLIFFERIRFGDIRICNVDQIRVQSGSSMYVILSSDVFRERVAGEAPYGLQDYIQRLNNEYPNRWIAGHLLNQDFGGPGDHLNLTPLTGNANRSHAIFEADIRRIGQAVINYEAQYPFSPYWYGIEYIVEIPNVPFLYYPDFNNVLNGVYSHIRLSYRLIPYNKTDFAPNAVVDNRIDVGPEFGAPPNYDRNNNTIRNLEYNNHSCYVEIHNCPNHIGLLE